MYKSIVCPRCQSLEAEEVSLRGVEAEFVCKKCGFKFKSATRIEFVE